MLSGCSVWPPGEDPNGKKYRKQANLLIDAAMDYKEKNGNLPSSLQELVPAYINELPDVANKSIYSKETGNLIYDYSPSWPDQGRISCFTVIGSAKWKCSGYI